MIWKRAAKKWYRVALSWQAWGEAHQADADRLRDVIWKLEKQLDEVGKMSNRRLELLIETERRVREHEFAHRRICPYCGCQIGLCYLAIGVDPITKHHAPDCELAEAIDE